ncbi:hypothetical protein LCGC14_0941920 [marine sediment metagenome]|uniref:DUF2958 domain-containing protein n=1 Tax=marine sediment metagenome TaxID=412755 RepID=A0A0F9RR62_9ZZZZ
MAYQKFITKEILNKIPALYAQEKKGDEAVVYAKWFAPWSNWTWFATELNPETGIAFGLVVGFETELGYFDINEMQELVMPGGLKIERDQWFSPKTLGKVKESLR